MFSDRKPIPKKRLGPAMQWAKPQAPGSRSATSHHRDFNIEVDLTGELEEEVSPTRATDNTRPSGKDERSADTRDGSAGTPGRSAGAVQSGGAHRSGYPRRSEAGSDEPSAWEFYAGDDSSTANLPQGYWAADNQGSSPYAGRQEEQYFRGTTLQDSSQYNRASWNSAPARREQPNKTSWGQYVWPFVVAAIILFLAFLT